MVDTLLVKPTRRLPRNPAPAAVLDALDTTSPAALPMSSVHPRACASTAVLGMATLGDVDRQLQAIRNRTTTMGVDQFVANEDMPYFNA